jgi:uncharacterized protein (DUF934 family)
MPLLDRTGLLRNPWVDGEASEATTASHVLVTLEQLSASLAVKSPSRQVGLVVPNTVDVEALGPHLTTLALIVIAFPSYGDGRGFSVARRLRAADYQGRLRARGPLIVDQFRYALACGFDEIELPDAQLARQPVSQWLAQLETQTLAYQRGYARSGNVLDARRSAREAWVKGASNV